MTRCLKEMFDVVLAKGDGGHDRKELISADGTAVADTDEPPHARASRESSSSVSEEDPDMNEDLDKPWAKPSLEHALQARKVSLESSRDVVLVRAARDSVTTL